MTGFEQDNRWQLHLKAWQRIRESAEHDDNPHIQDYIGRGEVKLGWNVNAQNYLGFTARGSLGQGRGSGRVEWLRTLGEGWNGGKSNLRLHVQLFSGYGDSLIDYNYKRTVLSVGFSLLDF
jgi:phospholipase A1